jgi:hypothetical protein
MTDIDSEIKELKQELAHLTADVKALRTFTTEGVAEDLTKDQYHLLRAVSDFKVEFSYIKEDMKPLNTLCTFHDKLMQELRLQLTGWWAGDKDCRDKFEYLYTVFF